MTPHCSDPGCLSCRSHVLRVPGCPGCERLSHYLVLSILLVQVELQRREAVLASKSAPYAFWHAGFVLGIALVLAATGVRSPTVYLTLLGIELATGIAVALLLRYAEERKLRRMAAELRERIGGRPLEPVQIAEYVFLTTPGCLPGTTWTGCAP